VRASEPRLTRVDETSKCYYYGNDLLESAQIFLAGVGRLDSPPSKSPPTYPTM
jgi:hypothetical protein